MADRESREPPETAASSPNSQSASANAPKAPKDRSCPFCGQAFTSSSLGRHLDLYIKPKNPKPADGVHDVDEIRKLRGGITRRQPKASLKSSTSASANASGWGQESASSTPHPTTTSKIAPEVDTRYTDGSPVVSPVNHKEGDSVQTVFNQANWQATGVINNLPPRLPSNHDNSTEGLPRGQAQRVQDMRRDAGGNRIQRPEYENESMWKLQEAAEVGRAAELALREVLGSLQAATQKVQPIQLFEDVDIFSLSFPGLCLAILPAPTTLFTPTPFPGVNTWALSPPGKKQYEALNIAVQARIKAVHGDRFPDVGYFKINAHLSGAYEHWQCMSEQDRASAWTLETLRAYSTVVDQRSQARRELEAAQNRIRHLEAEYDRLSRCQLPREYLLHPPNTMPAPVEIVKELNNAQNRSAAAEMDYDVDALLSKWRTAVKATTRRAPPTPASSSNVPAQKKGRTLEGDMILNGSVLGVNGVMPRSVDALPQDPGYVDRTGYVNQSGHVDYQTPPNPGAVVEAEDDEDGNADAEGEADMDDSGSFGEYVGKGALVMPRRNVGRMQKNGILNANGKRPLGSTPTNGRSGGAKIYREQPPEGDE